MSVLETTKRRTAARSGRRSLSCASAWALAHSLRSCLRLNRAGRRATCCAGATKMPLTRSVRKPRACATVQANGATAGLNTPTPHASGPRMRKKKCVHSAAPSRNSFAKNKKGQADGPPFLFARVSVHPEVHFHHYLHRNRLSVVAARFKFPFLYCFNSFFVEPQAKCVLHASIMHPAIRTDHARQQNISLVFQASRLFGVFGLGIVDHARHTHAASRGK